jgi:hypothetical protein
MVPRCMMPVLFLYTNLPLLFSTRHLPILRAGHLLADAHLIETSITVGALAVEQLPPAGIRVFS